MNPPQKSLAVALHYEKPGAPRVVAKGAGVIGEKIIETARENGVPIEENATLAAALSEVELGDEIPVELYKAVAEVLSFLIRVSGRRLEAAAPSARAFSGEVSTGSP